MAQKTYSVKKGSLFANKYVVLAVILYLIYILVGTPKGKKLDKKLEEINSDPENHLLIKEDSITAKLLSKFLEPRINAQLKIEGKSEISIIDALRKNNENILQNHFAKVIYMHQGEGESEVLCGSTVIIKYKKFPHDLNYDNVQKIPYKKLNLEIGKNHFPNIVENSMIGMLENSMRRVIVPFRKEASTNYLTYEIELLSSNFKLRKMKNLLEIYDQKIGVNSKNKIQCGDKVRIAYIISNSIIKNGKILKNKANNYKAKYFSVDNTLEVTYGVDKIALLLNIALQDLKFSQKRIIKVPYEAIAKLLLTHKQDNKKLQAIWESGMITKDDYFTLEVKTMKIE